MLPVVKGSRNGAIVITGSKQGITNPPGNVAYNASKAAVKIIAEHLSYDLKGTSTSVHLLIPGWTFTGLTGEGLPASMGKSKPAGAWSPDQVIDFLAQKMAEGAFYVLYPDNEVTEEMDRKRMLWSVGDAIYGRPPLSRWREQWKDKSQEWMASHDI
jgi:NAD(P)-dependent dehydrogenase (short-subunit alcohol dehydrogenase family)